MLGKLGFLCSISLFILATSQANAGFITHLSVGTTTDNGLTQYIYTLTTDPNSDRSAAELDIFVSKNASLTNIIGPSGWDISYRGGTLVSWSSEDSTTDLIPGSSTTFSFYSPLSRNLNNYIITGYDSNDNSATNFSQILSPTIASVPEPSSMIPLGIGMVAIAGYALYHRFRRV